MEEALHKHIWNFSPLSLALFYTVLTSCKDNQVWPPDLYFMKPFPVSSSPQFHNRRKTAVLSRSGSKETERVEEEGEREAGEWGLLLTASHLCSVSKCLPGTVLFSWSRAQYVEIMSWVIQQLNSQQWGKVLRLGFEFLPKHTLHNRFPRERLCVCARWTTNFQVTSSTWQDSEDERKTLKVSLRPL